MLHASAAQNQLPFFIRSPACGVDVERASAISSNDFLSARRLLYSGKFLQMRRLTKSERPRQSRQFIA